MRSRTKQLATHSTAAAPTKNTGTTYADDAIDILPSVGIRAKVAVRIPTTVAASIGVNGRSTGIPRNRTIIAGQ
jgi:hypothetical protein